MSELKRSHDEAEFEWVAHDFLKDIEGRTLNEVSEYRFYISPSFDFDAAIWCLKLAGQFVKDPESTTLSAIIIKSNAAQRSNLPLRCTYGLKNPDDTTEELGVVIMKANEKENRNSFPKLCNVMRQKVRQRTSKVPTITFTFKLELLHDFDEAQFSRLRKEDILSQNFKNLFAEMLNSDITICVKGKQFQAHKVVLIARSKAFADMLQVETSEEQPTIIKIECDPHTFPAFLEYLYCGKLEELPIESTLQLYETSKKFNAPELNVFCVEVLVENLTVETFCDIVSLGDKYNDAKLISGCEKFFCENSTAIFKTDEWECLSKINSPLSKKLTNELIEMSKIRLSNSLTEAEYRLATKKVTF